MHRNVQNVLAVIGIGEGDSGASMLQASAILEKKNDCFSAIGDMENTFFKGEIAKLHC